MIKNVKKYIKKKNLNEDVKTDGGNILEKGK